MRDTAHRCIRIGFESLLVLLVSSAIVLGQPASARELTLSEALDIAVNQSSRGGIIDGNFEVAEQNFKAKQINFYLPEISINGSVPAYNEDETYRFFGGANQKALYKTRDLGFSSFIRMKQSLFTGGDLEVRANLTANDERYPNVQTGSFYYDNTRQGFFNFEYAQPLLKPSASKYELNNRRDDLEIARYARVEELEALQKEVTEAYMGVMRTSLALDVTGSKLEKARLQASIDSAKFSDGVISEEDLLESTSALLDAELENFEAETEAREKARELAMLLDLDVAQPLQTTEPEIANRLGPEQTKHLADRWEEAVAVKKAEHQYEKSKRAADYAAGAHGLTGDLALSYSLGRGSIDQEIDGETSDENIKTNSWGVALNFTYPIWDGGASGAAVKAERHQAQQARLEYQKAKQAARADIINTINRLDVSYRRLEIVKKQIDLAANRLRIAESRLADGQISQLTYLEKKVFYLETKDRYLEELNGYLINRIELNGKFAG